MKIATVLVPVDFSDVTAKLVRMAGGAARAFGGKVVLLHVSEPEPAFVGFEPGPQVFTPPPVRDYTAEREQLEEWRSVLSREGLDVTALHQQGSIVERVLTAAQEHGAGMIVIGSHGHGALYSLLVGSVTSGVLKSAECPVLVVPADRSPQ